MYYVLTDYGWLDPKSVKLRQLEFCFIYIIIIIAYLLFMDFIDESG